MDSKYYEYLNNIIDNDGLVSNVNYNFSESPSTQQYHSVAAHDNPDYAQAIGDIYRWGDVNRAKFNMDLGLTSALNRKKYLEKMRDEQRAYAEKLKNEQRAYNEKQQAKAWARADAKAKELRDQQLNDMKFQLAMRFWDKEQEEPRNISGYTPYRTNNYNTNLDLDQLAQERQDLIDVGNKLFAPENLSGNSINEMLYNALMAEKQHQQNVKDYNKKAANIRSNYQEDLLRNAAENTYLTGAPNTLFHRNRASDILSKNDDRSYAAKLINEDPFLGLTHLTKYDKSRDLDQFMRDYNAVSIPGWNTDTQTSALKTLLQQMGYNTNTMAPLYSAETDTNYIYDNSTGTFYELAKDDLTNNYTLVPIQQVEDQHKFKLGKLFNNLVRESGIVTPRILNERPDNFGE